MPPEKSRQSRLTPKKKPEVVVVMVVVVVWGGGLLQAPYPVRKKT